MLSPARLGLGLGLGFENLGARVRWSVQLANARPIARPIARRPARRLAPPPRLPRPSPHLSRLIASPHDRPSTRHDAMRSVLRTLALAPCAAIAPRPCPCRLADMAMYSEMVTLTHQFPDLF